MADLVFQLAANAVCGLTKGLNEITLRRAFLDRRKCIDTTIRFEYEKGQEVLKTSPFLIATTSALNFGANL